MTLPRLIDAFGRLAPWRALRDGLPPRGGRVGVGGLPGSSGAVLAAALARAHPQRVLLVVAPVPAVAERWLADLEVLVDDAVRLYPQREALG